MAEAMEVELSGAEARALTDRIKIAVEGTWQLIQEAYVSRAWSALGYQSWDDYCTREFGTSRLRLPREERQEVVASLRESGLSTRAIAAATGLGRGTVERAIASTVPIGTVEAPRVTGVNGKSYSVPTRRSEDTDETETKEPTTMTTPPAQDKKRRPLTDAFKDVAYDLQKVVERVDRLTTDDRFARNAEQVGLISRPDLSRALDLLTTAVGRIPVPAEKG